MNNVNNISQVLSDNRVDNTNSNLANLCSNTYLNLQNNKTENITNLNNRKIKEICKTEIELTVDAFLSKIQQENSFCNDIKYIINSDVIINRDYNNKNIDSKEVFFPNNLIVNGDLKIHKLNKINNSADTIIVHGDLILQDIKDSTLFCTNLILDQDLNVKDCNIKKLANECTIGGSISFYSSSIMEFPRNIKKVNGNLYLSFCDEIESLPANLTEITGSLLINYCTKLNCLPVNLTIGMRLSIINLANIQESRLVALPSKLHIGNNLRLNNIPIEYLPEDLVVLGSNINLNQSIRLRSLPSWITNLGLNRQTRLRGQSLHQNNQIVHVYLVNTGLSEDITTRLREAHAPYMQFHWSIWDLLNQPTYKPEIIFDNFSDAFNFWLQIANINQPIPNISHLNFFQVKNLIVFLSRLTATAEYKNQATQKVLAYRLLEILDMLKVNNQNTENMLTIIFNSLATCDDRIILALNNLEIMEKLETTKTQAIEQKNDKQLRLLAQQLVYIEEIQKIAAEHIKKLTWVDEVEVLLAFQIGLKKYLELIVSTKKIIFLRCAQVSNDDIVNAARQIKMKCTEEYLNKFLLTWEPWQQFQRSLHVIDFNLLEVQQVAKIENCYITGELTEDMVLVENTHVSFNALKRYYIEKGKSIITEKYLLQWDNIKRLKILA